MLLHTTSSCSPILGDSPYLSSKFLEFQRPKETVEPEEATLEKLQIEESVEEVKTDGVFTVKISSAPTTSTGDARGAGEQEPGAEKKFVPHPRMSTCMAIKHGILYLYGGIFESGKLPVPWEGLLCLTPIWLFRTIFMFMYPLRSITLRAGRTVSAI